MADDRTFFGIRVAVDPDMPPGVIEARPDGDRMRVLIGDGDVRAMAETMRQRAEVDPAFAEDIKSVLESKDFITRSYEMTDPIRCECCGASVALVPEMLIGGHEFRPAIWDVGQWRKHTARRCDAMRRLADG